MCSGMGRRGLSGLQAGAVLVLVFSGGCLNRQLELTTRRTVNTLPDLNYQQVMDNLAAVGSNPGLLPYLAVAGQGTIQVTDNGNSTFGLTMPFRSPTSEVLGMGASRNITGTWNLGTITCPDKIRGMHAVYQRAIAGSVQRDPAYVWLHVGGKRDVPRGASYVGRRGNVSVWVAPEGVAGLSELTLSILDIATRDETAPAPISFGGGSRKGAVPRRNFQVPASGPVFTPGTG